MKRLRASDLFIGGFLAVQLLLPIRYYLFGGGQDERFSWRMFSSRRLTRCTYEVVADGDVVPVREVLGDSPYTHALLPNGDPDVVVGFMRWWCDRNTVERVRYRNSCRAPDGEEPPPRHASIECASGVVDREGLP